MQFNLTKKQTYWHPYKRIPQTNQLRYKKYPDPNQMFKKTGMQEEKKRYVYFLIYD